MRKQILAWMLCLSLLPATTQAADVGGGTIVITQDSCSQGCSHIIP